MCDSRQIADGLCMRGVGRMISGESRYRQAGRRLLNHSLHGVDQVRQGVPGAPEMVRLLTLLESRLADRQRSVEKEAEEHQVAD